MIIETLAVGPLMANCYIVGCEQSRAAAVIDPGDEGERILQRVAALDLTVAQIVNTHGHFDHVGANRHLKTATSAELLIHAADAPMLAMLAETAAAWGLAAENSPAPDRTLGDGDRLRIGDLEFAVRHTPGHSPGGIALCGTACVFVGDTLFAGSIGRSDLPGGDHTTLLTSIRDRLFDLDDAVVVYPGHGPETTIGREKRTNPFVGMF